jgi:3-deoxy-D-manno-octulosonic acid kinase
MNHAVHDTGYHLMWAPIRTVGDKLTSETIKNYIRYHKHKEKSPKQLVRFLMSTTFIRKYGTYHFGSSLELTDHQLNRLVKVFETPTHAVDSVLGGRTSVAAAQLEGIGAVVVKHYTRGGLIRYLVRRRYLRWGKTRSQSEYEVLQTVRNLGISAPEPIAYASTEGLFFYRAWLVTREIKQPSTLAELSCANQERTQIVMAKVIYEVSKLVKNYIYHADLHPGNVLVNSSDRVFILDFDKACLSRKNRNKLRDQYISRWRRAVVKHRLPKTLSQMMEAGLRKDWDDMEIELKEASQQTKGNSNV